MQGILQLPAPPDLDVLQASGPLALFLDFDGTLVEIAPTPDGISVPVTLADRLHRLSDRLDGRVALVSGRAIADIEGFLGSLRLPRAGSHGIDRRLADGSVLGTAPDAFPAIVKGKLDAFVSDSGFVLETKPHGSALHFRSDPTLEEEGLEFATQLAAEHGLQVKRGKCVIELVRPGADKGGAVHAFMQHEGFAGSRPYFIGDDVTDEDGFAAVQEYGGAGILVGDREPTRAQYRLAGPSALHDWLGL